MKNKRIKIFLILAYVAFSSAGIDNVRFPNEDEFIMSRIDDAINLVDFSSSCKSDLNTTLNAYRERKSWAIASKDLWIF